MAKRIVFTGVMISVMFIIIGCGGGSGDSSNDGGSSEPILDASAILVDYKVPEMIAVDQDFFIDLNVTDPDGIEIVYYVISDLNVSGVSVDLSDININDININDLHPALLLSGEIPNVSGDVYSINVPISGVLSPDTQYRIEVFVKGVVVGDVSYSDSYAASFFYVLPEDDINVNPDTTPPVITINGDTSVEVVQFGTYTDAGASATDNMDGSVSVSSTGSVDMDTVGVYDINFIATDIVGNSATVTRSVTVTAFSISHNGIIYGAVKSPYTGKIWLDRNLGAAQVCTSFDDVACYGDYYQWGRNFDGHEDSMSGTTNVQAIDVNNAGSDFITDDGTNDYDWAKTVDSDGSLRQANWSKTDGSSVCPVGFRVPNITELSAETLDNGVVGSVTAFTNFLKLPSAGNRGGFFTSMNDVGTWGYVWASSVYGSSSRNVGFYSGGADWYIEGRAYGTSVRCLRD